MPDFKSSEELKEEFDVWAGVLGGSLSDVEGWIKNRLDTIVELIKQEEEALKEIARQQLVLKQRREELNEDIEAKNREFQHLSEIYGYVMERLNEQDEERVINEEFDSSTQD